MEFSYILDFLFPVVCVHCGVNTDTKIPLCAECEKKVSVFTSLFCAVCRARLPEGKKICHPGAQFILGAATHYEGAVKSLVHALKFKGSKIAASPLSNFLVAYASALGLDGSILIPIPLGAQRLRERGYNQAELIAAPLALKLNIPLDTNILARKKETKPQSELRGHEERENNVLDSFEVRRPELVKSKKILLLDDVVTSGATLVSAAKALKSAGARKIIALAAAQA